MERKEGLEQWRTDKIEFVSNLEGGSSQEVILAMSVVPALTLIFTRELIRLLPVKSTVLTLLLEFTFYIAPIVIEFTVLSDHIVSLCVGLVVAILCLVHIKAFSSKRQHKNEEATKSDNDNNDDDDDENKKAAGSRQLVAALTEFRGTLSYVTAAAILAVDFRIFPRRFAKTEVAGFSLMDAGVGLFSMSSGITTSMKTVSDANSNSNKDSTSKRTKRSIKNKRNVPWRTIFILFGLGLARLIAVKASGYPEHISEYGVHWNFFFTLGSVSLIVSLLGIHNAWTAMVLASIILCVRSFAGATRDLDSWILDRVPLRRPLPDYWNFVPLWIRRIIEDNREGLLSVPGFVAIELLGYSIGAWLLKPFQLVGPNDRKKFVRLSVRSCIHGGAISFVLWVAVNVLGSINALPSRVLVNVPYVMFTASVGLASVSTLLCGWALFGNYAEENRGTLCTASGASTNMLATFLVANVATGLVNFSVNSITVPPVPSLCILLVYMLAVSSFAFICNKYNLRIK